jgi:hypothetical protein
MATAKSPGTVEAWSAVRMARLARLTVIIGVSNRVWRSQPHDRPAHCSMLKPADDVHACRKSFAVTRHTRKLSVLHSDASNTQSIDSPTRQPVDASQLHPLPHGTSQSFSSSVWQMNAWVSSITGFPKNRIGGGAAMRGGGESATSFIACAAAFITSVLPSPASGKSQRVELGQHPRTAQRARWTCGVSSSRRRVLNPNIAAACPPVHAG